jgi:hypothetical protein
MVSSAPEPSATATASLSTGYTPTTGFVYFPAQYQNEATKVEDHVQNF